MNEAPVISLSMASHPPAMECGLEGHAVQGLSQHFLGYRAFIFLKTKYDYGRKTTCVKLVGLVVLLNDLEIISKIVFLTLQYLRANRLYSVLQLLPNYS